jgi:hypothetical protein
MAKAVEWAIEAFRAAGIDVHTEKYTLPVTWSEGKTELIVSDPSHLVSPPETDRGIEMVSLRAVSVGWGPPLTRENAVSVVDVGYGSGEEFARAASIKDKFLLVHSDIGSTWADLFNEYLRPPDIIKRAVAGGARAILWMGARERLLLYRHTNSLNGEIDKIPQAVVAREDAMHLARLVAAYPGRVTVMLLMPNKIGGPIEQENVVGEIRGYEKPDEVVILGAHLDSWELGTGALDNGCNAALVIDALRAIKASGEKPKRSIRFILFSGEEEGLLGSRAYALAHRGELDHAAGVVIFDSGTGKTTGFSVGGRKDIIDTAHSLIAPLEQFGVKDLKPDMEWGTDHFDFMLEGVPTFVADQEEANYLENYHAISDTYDKVDFAQLKKHVAEAAVLSVGLADLPEKIGPRLTHDQIDQTIRESHSVDLFKAFGLWDDWVSGKHGRQK